MNSTIAPEEQAAQDELERARARREELAAKAEAAATPELDGGVPADDEPAEEAVPVAELDDGQFVLTVGGKAPTQHLVTILGGQIGVDGMPEGGFVKGESYELRVVVKCRGHVLDDAEDGKTGQVIDTKKVDRLKIRSAAVV